ncbi:MAG: hypothetical protein Q8K60_03855 [Parachlamydiaceae bacterium]|nr:hypothetical protein [Parachlamydiaceae bacterium]
MFVYFLKSTFRYFFTFFFILNFLNAEEIFDSKIEKLYLKNIRQLTYPSMGFEKAGEAYFSPDDQTIAFQAVPKGKTTYQIYKMNLEEQIPFLMSTGIGACTCSFFHPFKNKMIFASSHSDPELSQECILSEQSTTKTGNYKWDLTPYMNIYEINLDGSGLTQLTSGAAYHAECAYSPDGSEIVFASNVSGSMHLYVMNSDGSDVKKITTIDHCYHGGPFFSPDGKRIIFRVDRDQVDYLQIYLIDKDGSNEHQLTNNGAVNWAPYWHPNGKVVAFTTSIHGHRHYEIYLINIETGVEYRLTHHSGFDGLPVFSHDGKKIMWTSKRGEDGTCQIFIADFTMPPELE